MTYSMELSSPLSGDDSLSATHKFLSFYVTLKFITVSLRFLLTFYSHLCLGLPSSVFSSGFLAKIFMCSLRKFSRMTAQLPVTKQTPFPSY
jgi:hypothetical protein